MRGRKLSWIACIVVENAPDIRACDAMMAASVAMTTSGICAQFGAMLKKGLKPCSNSDAGCARAQAPWPR